MGLTDVQLAKLNKLQIRQLDPKAKPLTKTMEADLYLLEDKFSNPELPVGCITYLKEWYANDYEEIQSKHLTKGIYVEEENIDFAARVLGYGLAEKNTLRFSDEHMEGEPDSILPDAILETKAPWSRSTLQQQVMEPLNTDYEWQTRVYMRLVNKPKAYLFYGLQNTPETDFRQEVVYDNMPENERWFAHLIVRDESLESEVIERVKLCRSWLKTYEKALKSKLGTVL